MFQAFHLLERRPVTDSVELGLLYRRIPRRQRQLAAIEALAQVGLADRAGQDTSLLSGGGGAIATEPSTSRGPGTVPTPTVEGTAAARIAQAHAVTADYQGAGAVGVEWSPTRADGPLQDDEVLLGAVLAGQLELGPLEATPIVTLLVALGGTFAALRTARLQPADTLRQQVPSALRRPAVGHKACERCSVVSLASPQSWPSAEGDGTCRGEVVHAPSRWPPRRPGTRACSRT